MPPPATPPASGSTIAAFAPGLLMFSVHYIVLRGFYAMEDTRTPFFIQCVIAAVNIALAITFTNLAAPEHASVDARPGVRRLVRRRGRDLGDACCRIGWAGWARAGC